MVESLVKSGVHKGNSDVYNIEGIYTYKSLGDIQPYALTHNVPNCAYSIMRADGNVFYATDTNSLEHIKAIKGFDLYLVEANYDEDEIAERIRAKQAAGEHVYEYDAVNNHLSRQKCDDWLYQNMGSNSRYVYLHGHVDELKNEAVLCLTES
jgi:hypothetical protein